MITQQYTIGRGEECRIRIQDSGQRISRQHATLKVMKNGKIFITDHSTNGTFVNGIKITPDVDFPVKRGNRISFANEVELDWKLIARTKNKILLYAVIVGLLIAAGIVAFYLWGGSYTPQQPGQELVPADSLELDMDSLEIGEELIL